MRFILPLVYKTKQVIGFGLPENVDEWKSRTNYCLFVQSETAKDLGIAVEDIFCELSLEFSYLRAKHPEETKSECVAIQAHVSQGSNWPKALKNKTDLQCYWFRYFFRTIPEFLEEHPDCADLFAVINSAGEGYRNFIHVAACRLCASGGRLLDH